MNSLNKTKFGLAVVSIILIATASGCSMPDWFPGSGPQIHTTATPLARPSFTPRPTNTAWPTFTPSPTIALATPTFPGILTGVISATVNVRSGPGTNYSAQRTLSKGLKISARGRDLDAEWLYLVPPPNGWIKASFVTLSGDINNLPVVDAPPTPAPTPTTAPSATPNPTATPPMYVDFRADAPYLPLGACTSLRWDVEGVRGVYLEGRGQPGHGSEEVCPRETHTYVLHVVLNSGYLDRAITIAVLGVTSPTPKS